MTTPDQPSDKIREAPREVERLTEDEIARRKLGPRGVPGAPDTATMTPQYRKNLRRKANLTVTRCKRPRGPSSRGYRTVTPSSLIFLQSHRLLI